jgi:hypothetical protein
VYWLLKILKWALELNADKAQVQGFFSTIDASSLEEILFLIQSVMMRTVIGVNLNNTLNPDKPQIELDPAFNSTLRLLSLLRLYSDLKGQPQLSTDKDELSSFYLRWFKRCKDDYLCNQGIAKKGLPFLLLYPLHFELPEIMRELLLEVCQFLTKQTKEMSSVGSFRRDCSPATNQIVRQMFSSVSSVSSVSSLQRAMNPLLEELEALQKKSSSRSGNYSEINLSRNSAASVF